MSNQRNDSYHAFRDRTIDPSDPEPKFVDRLHPTPAEDLAYSEWIARNFEALFQRGVECYIDEDYEGPWGPSSQA
jgi:hypothetical protein